MYSIYEEGLLRKRGIWTPRVDALFGQLELGYRSNCFFKAWSLDIIVFFINFISCLGVRMSATLEYLCAGNASSPLEHSSFFSAETACFSLGVLEYLLR